MCGLVDMRIGGYADWWICGLFDMRMCEFLDVWIFDMQII